MDTSKIIAHLRKPLNVWRTLLIFLVVLLQSRGFNPRNGQCSSLSLRPPIDHWSFNRLRFTIIARHAYNHERNRANHGLSANSSQLLTDGSSARLEAQQALKDQGIDLEDLLDLRHFTMANRHRSASRGSSSVTTISAAEDDFYPHAEKTLDSASVSKRKRGILMRPTEMTINAGERPRSATLDGVTLKTIVSFFVDPSVSPYSPSEGFNLLYKATHLRCFLAENRPSLSSTLVLLRKPAMRWARDKIGDLYLKLRSGEADR